MGGYLAALLEMSWEGRVNVHTYIYGKIGNSGSWVEFSCIVKAGSKIS